MSAKRQKPTRTGRKAKSLKRAAVTKRNKPVPVFENFRTEAGDRQIVLHIGCGEYHPNKLHSSFRSDQWFELRLDINPDVNPHIVADMRDLSVVPNDSVQAVWSSHNLEHLFAHDVSVALKEMFRVIMPGGVLLITMPDLQSVATYVAHGNLLGSMYDSPAGPIAPIDAIYGYREAIAKGNHFMAHRTGFTAETLKTYLFEAGFTNLQLTRKWVDLWAVGHKFLPGDPRRAEKANIKIDQENGKMKLPDPLPINRVRHPGQFAPNILTDELNIPPNEWEPIGLGSITD